MRPCTPRSLPPDGTIFASYPLIDNDIHYGYTFSEWIFTMNRRFFTARGSVSARQVLRRGSAAMATAALMGGATLIPSTSVAFAQDGDGAKQVELTKSGHIPGNESEKPTVGKDVKYKTKSGKTNPHPCAGKKLIYQFHNDFIYGTRDRTNSEKGELAVMAVDGQQVVNQNTVCFRLPVDANKDGKDLTRKKLPLDPKDPETYKFLGNKDDIVWLAPQQPENWLDDNRPTYAGIGAFDPHHEGTPVKKTDKEKGTKGDFVGDEMHFDIVKYSGPGDMHVFASRPGRADRLFSVKKGQKKLPSFAYGVNGHGHWNTAFTKPGIYTLTVKGWVENKDGTKEETKPTQVRWLVGTDKEVGLPEGTTTDLREVKSSPADDNSSNGADKPNESGKASESDKPSDSKASGTTPSPSTENGESDSNSGNDSGKSDQTGADTTGTNTEPAPTCSEEDKVDEETAKALANKPQNFIEKGHIDMALDEGKKKKFETRIHVDGSDGKTTNYRSGSFAFLVPDTRKEKFPNGFGEKLGLKQDEIWYLPQVQDQNAPWPGFSTQKLGVNWSQNSQGVKVTMDKKSGPGDVVSWNDNVGSSTVIFSSKEPSKEFPLIENSHVHMNWGFTKPGIYRVVFNMKGKDDKGKEINEPLDAVFLVGKDAIEKARDLKKKGYPCIDGAGVDGTAIGGDSNDPNGGGTDGDGSTDSTEGDAESDGDQPAGADTDEGAGKGDDGSGEAGGNSEEGEDGSREGLLASTGIGSMGVIVTLLAGLVAMLVGAGVMMNRQTQQMVLQHKETMMRNRKGRS